MPLRGATFYDRGSVPIPGRARLITSIGPRELRRCADRDAWEDTVTGKLYIARNGMVEELVETSTREDAAKQMEIAQLKQTLALAGEQLKSQQEFIDRMVNPFLGLATFIRFNEDDKEDNKYKSCMVSNAGGVVQVIVPPGDKYDAFVAMARVGAQLRVNTKTAQIVGFVNDPIANGAVVSVTRVISPYAEIGDGTQSQGRAVYIGSVAVETGDRVLLDQAGLVVMKNLGKPPNDGYLLESATNVQWDDIGGNEEAKQALREAIEYPHLHAEIYKHYGKALCKGVMLYGPPGCGKTMLGKAAATSLAAIHGVTGSSGFFYVKGPEILNKYVGESEAAIRSLFTACREHKRKHGYPALLFIDEADAIMTKRGAVYGSTLVERTIVPMFLSEMDGMDENGATVILATNRPDSLDPAITREGRIDRKVKVSRPTRTEVATIALLHLEGRPIFADSIARLAALVSDEVFRGDRLMYRVKLKTGGYSDFSFSNLVSGALIAGVIEQAASLAMGRDLSTKNRTGITANDLKYAVDDVMRANSDVDHLDVLGEFVAEFKDDIETVIKTKRAA